MADAATPSKPAAMYDFGTLLIISPNPTNKTAQINESGNGVLAVANAPVGPNNGTTPTSELGNAETAVVIQKKLAETEAKYTLELNTALLSITPPDFKWPDVDCAGPKAESGRILWNSIVDRYNNARKIKELDPKFGRIEQIIFDLRCFEQLFPNSSSAKRHLAYLRFISGYLAESADLFNKAALISKDAVDWFNFAAVLLKAENPLKAVWAMAKGYEVAPLDSDEGKWKVFVHLISTLKAHSALKTAIAGRSKLSASEEELAIEGVIFLCGSSSDLSIMASILNTKIPFAERVKLGVSELEKTDLKKSDLNRIAADSLRAPATVSIVREQEDVFCSPANPAATQEKKIGEILKYDTARAFGFIKRKGATKDYFFHISSIKDQELIGQLENGKGNGSSVSFVAAEGPKGHIATNIILARSKDRTYSAAKELAEAGDYAGATRLIGPLAASDITFKDSVELLNRWSELEEKFVAAPKGTDVYSRAQRAQYVKNYPLALELYQQAVAGNIKRETSVKNMANMLVEMKRPKDALEFFTKNMHFLSDSQSREYMLAEFQRNAGLYGESEKTYRKVLASTATPNKRVYILTQISCCLAQKGDISELEKIANEILAHQPWNKQSRRLLAAAYLAKKEFDKAEKILHGLISECEDGKAIALMADLEAARKGTQVSSIDIFDTSFSGLDTDLTKFTKYFLENLESKAHPEVVQGKRAPTEQDVSSLISAAKNFKSVHPRDRGSYYLTAAKLVKELPGGDYNSFYSCVSRSFASLGDAAVIESKDVDVAQEFYAEALHNYDSCIADRIEQDPVNAIVRFMYSTQGIGRVPLETQAHSIPDALESVLRAASQSDKVFDAMAYLVSRSRFAEERIIGFLADKTTPYTQAVDYLRRQHNINIKSAEKMAFSDAWNTLVRKMNSEYRALAGEIQALVGISFTNESVCVFRTNRPLFRFNSATIPLNSAISKT